MMTKHKIAIAAVAAFAVLVTGGIAFAAWLTSGTGGGAASASTLAAPTIGTPTASGSTVTVNWTPSTAPAGQLDGFYVTRNNGTADSNACGTDPATPSTYKAFNASSCSDAGLANGTYTYKVTAVFKNWRSASSSSNSVVVNVATDTTPPSSNVSFPLNGNSYNATGWAAGCNVSPFNTGSSICGTAADNVGGSGVASISVSIQAGSGNYWDPSGTPGFKSATEVKIPATFSAPNWTLGFPASNLTDGVTYSIRSYATDNANNTQATATLSQFTYDTTAPTQPTSVALANGGGSGSAYINIANSTAVTFNVAWATNAANKATDTVTVTLTSSGGGSAIGTATRGSTSPTAVTVDSTSGTLADGTITATAKAADIAGNSSGTRTNSTTINRDTTAPSIAVTFPTANVSGSTAWNAGCGTASTGDVCGTASDTGSGVATTKTSINKGSGLGTGNSTCQQNGVNQTSHFNQGCPQWDDPDGTGTTATSWIKLMPYATGTYTISVQSTDVAGNVTTTTFTSFTVS